MQTDNREETMPGTVCDLPIASGMISQQSNVSEIILHEISNTNQDQDNSIAPSAPVLEGIAQIFSSFIQFL